MIIALFLNNEFQNTKSMFSPSPITVAPLEEVDYVSQDQLNLQLNNGDNSSSEFNPHGPGACPKVDPSDFHRQLLNIPMTSEGSHDSHNDSGYSTRLGFSAGPSPSLSGTFKITFFFVIGE